MECGAVLLAALAVALFASACAGPSVREGTTLTPAEAVEARRAIVAWLECEECTSGELDAVVRLQERAVPSLVTALHEGPSPMSREAYRRHLVATYGKLKAHRAARGGPALPVTEERYVQMYLDNYIALYRVRSATALGRIGGPEGRRALETALGAGHREDVRGAIANALTGLEKR